MMASAAPPWTAVTIVLSSLKNVHSWPSSGVWPPHQSGLRSNVAPVAGSNVPSFHGPVPLGDASSVVPIS